MKLEKGRIVLAWLLLLGCSAPLDREPPRQTGTQRERATIESDLDQLVQETIRAFSSFPQPTLPSPRPARGTCWSACSAGRTPKRAIYPFFEPYAISRFARQ
jgi:hypothetical protein